MATSSLQQKGDTKFCVVCCVALIGVGFIEVDSKLYCEKDYEKHVAPACKKCNGKITGERVSAMEMIFHPECFTCSQCGVSIGAGSFHVEAGQFYCQKDWQARFQTKCFGCQFPVEPGDRWIEAMSHNWHSECFNCATCQVNLEGASFYKRNGKPSYKMHSGPGRRF